MIEPTTDAARINAVLNHPGVRPWIADWTAGEIDVAPILSQGRSLCLMGEHGLFFLFKYDVGIWEVHTAVLPTGRGEWSRQFAEAGSRFMFTQSDCVEILTRVPEGHIAAKALTEAMGFIWQFDTPPECPFRGDMVPVHVYSLPIQQWAPRVMWAERDGERFHAWLNKEVNGSTPHDPDPGHNRTVGIVMAMIRGGQVQKGIMWYNRAALVSRHPLIALLDTNPVRIKFDAGVLRMASDGGVELERMH